MVRLFCLLAVGAAVLAGEPRYLGKPEGLPADDVLDLCSGGPERVWAATAAGLCSIEAYEIRVVGPAEGAPRRLAPAAGGAVYALYPDRLALVGEAVTWLDLPIDPARTPPLLIARGGDGDLRLFTREEAFALRADGSWEAVREVRPEAMPRTVHRGEVWTATRGRGILRERIPPRFRRLELAGVERVNALGAAPGGDIWCGTDRGVARISGDSIETIRAVEGKPLGVVTACGVDREGRVWIGSGSSFRGVYRRDAKGWTHLSEIAGYVHRITIDPTGVLWFAVLHPEGEEGRGAWSFSDGRFRPAPAIASVPSARVYDVVARDPSGVLWFATLKGLAAYDGKGHVTQFTPENHGLRGEKVWCLSAARDGSLWIGYQHERGVSRLARGEITHYDVEDGLCDGNVWSIVEGRPGVLWFATQNGLSRYDGRRWSCFRNEEGLGDVPIWPLLPRDDGTLWIGTLGGGLVHLVPGDEEPPRTRFSQEAYRASGEVTVEWIGSDAWFDTPRDRLWYRWRCDEGRWSRASPESSVTLALPPGRHSFQVQAIDRFGNAEDPPARVVVEVVDPAGLSWIAITAVAVVLLIVGFAVGRRAWQTGS